MPPGVVNVVAGVGEAGAALAAHPGVDKIAFTGSTEVGQKIVPRPAGNLKRMSIELGGKSPNIVFADADLDAAVPGAAMAVFPNSGQICSAGTRLFVQRPIYDEFVAAGRRVCEDAARRRPARPADAARPGGLGRAARSRHRLPRARPRAGREGARRRRAPDRRPPRPRLLRRADRLRRRRRRHAHRTRRDLRPGALGNAVRRRRRGDPPRQRHPVRPRRRRLVAQRQHRAPRRARRCAPARYGSTATS